MLKSSVTLVDNIRNIFETELVRLDSKLETGAPNAANTLNAVLSNIDSLRTEIHYLVNDVRILEERKTDFTQDDFTMAFKNAGLVHLLLANPRINPNDYAMIKKAVEEGQTEVVRLLLTRVDPSAINNFAIKHASKMGYTEIVRLLLTDPRVDPSAKSNYAIRLASRKGFTEIVRMLLANPRVNPDSRK